MTALGIIPISLGDAAAALRELADPRDYVKTQLDTAARLTGLAYWRAFDIWYGKARRLEDTERDAIAAALERKRDQEARNELHELRIRLARLESLLLHKEPPAPSSSAGADRSLDGTRGVSRRPVVAAPTR